MLFNEFVRARHFAEFHDPGGLQTDVGENPLGKSPVIFQPIAVAAAADDRCLETLHRVAIVAWSGV